jgi:hypothetical protein
MPLNVTKNKKIKNKKKTGIDVPGFIRGCNYNNKFVVQVVFFRIVIINIRKSIPNQQVVETIDQRASQRIFIFVVVIIVVVVV